MICADVRLTEFTNHQPHDAPIPDPLLRDAVRWPAGGYEEVAKVEVNVGGEGSDLFIKSFTWGGPNVGEGLIKFIPCFTIFRYPSLQGRLVKVVV